MARVVGKSKEHTLKITCRQLSAEELAEAIKLLPSVKRVHIEHTITSLETRLAQSSAEVAVMREAGKALLGIFDLFLSRNDLPVEVRACMQSHWRISGMRDAVANSKDAAQELLADLKDAETNAEHYIHLAFVDAGANGPVTWKDRAEAAEQQIAQIRATQRTVLGSGGGYPPQMQGVPEALFRRAYEEILARNEPDEIIDAILSRFDVAEKCGNL